MPPGGPSPADDRPEDTLHRGIVHWLFDQGWHELREVQRAAIRAFRETDDDLIITARTAGGKTEAAFLPVLSAIADDPGGGVRALYVGPLRALINDQFRRMEDLCTHLEIPVHRWHGEVGTAARKRLIEDPGGVLLITPESIESLFLNRGPHVPHLFARLDCCVIDELHVFPGTERGQHLRSLLSRLEAVRGAPFRRLGLSATLARPDEAATWLRSEAPERVRTLQAPDEGGEFRTRVHAYATIGEPKDAPPDEEPEALAEADRLVPDLVRHHPEGTTLVFANSRRTTEETAARTREWFESRRRPADRVLVHHGSVGKILREEAEQSLLEGGDKLCFCTSTLELGIDLGDVRAVAHVGAPHRASSAAQRIGRSGRRPGSPTIFRQYVVVDPRTEEIDERALFFPLLRAVVLVECYLDGWVEPAPTGGLHLSTFVHQVLCVIAQHHGCSAPDLYEILANRGNFHWISQDAFVRTLRHLGEQRLISQMSDGTLLLDAEGERWVESREIYAVFQTPEDWRVEHAGATIGTVPLENVLLPGDKLLLAGRNWRVTTAHLEGRVLEVEPSAQGKPAIYGGAGGDVHPELLARMRRLLESSDAPPRFCDTATRDLVELARARFAEHVADTAVTATRGGLVSWTWAGTMVDRTLAALLRMTMPDREIDYGHATVEVACSPDDLAAAIADLRRRDDLEVDLIRFLADHPALLRTEKFDEYLPDRDLAVQHVHDRLHVEGARRWLEAQGPPPG